MTITVSNLVENQITMKIKKYTHPNISTASSLVVVDYEEIEKIAWNFEVLKLIKLTFKKEKNRKQRNWKNLKNFEGITKVKEETITPV